MFCLAGEWRLWRINGGYQIGEVMEKMSRLNSLQTETAAELDALMPSILNKAFKGEL
jgi:hypothetical protein